MNSDDTNRITHSLYKKTFYSTNAQNKQHSNTTHQHRYENGQTLDLSMLFAVKSEIAKDVEEIKVEIEGTERVANFFDAKLRVHTYVLDEDGAGEEMLSEEQEVSSLSQWNLPAIEFKDSWDTLVFDSEIKQRLLRYAMSAMRFSQAGVNKSVISINRVVLLHGPPGTGKTTLCKALAQKLAIRMSNRYESCHLLEINAHSLFSKWFSESGKLVMKLFEHILELVEEEDSLVCILIDEVESLSAARKSAASGNEPSDAIRVVNALLTQIDRLRTRDNVLILTTSNITEAIDVAFVDRADIKQYIGLPSHRARFMILRSCVMELARVGLVSLPKVSTSSFMNYYNKEHDTKSIESDGGLLLSQVAERCQGLSGRALRKLPLQAHSAYLVGTKGGDEDEVFTLNEFLTALLRAAIDEQKCREELNMG